MKWISSAGIAFSMSWRSIWTAYQGFRHSREQAPGKAPGLWIGIDQSITNINAYGVLRELLDGSPAIAGAETRGELGIVGVLPHGLRPDEAGDRRSQNAGNRHQQVATGSQEGQINVGQTAQRQKVLWQEMLRHEFMAALDNRPVVIVPVGSVEQHGPALPDGRRHLDSLPSGDSRRRCDRRLPGDRRAAGDLRLHPLQHGRGRHDHARTGGLHRRAVRRLPQHLGERIPPHHHGSTATAATEQPTWTASVKLAEEDVWALAITYWNMATDELLAWSEADNGSIGHGGEWETSLQLYLRRHLVDESLRVKDEWRMKFSPDVQRYAVFPERRREMQNGVMGDPFVATAEKGERLFNVLSSGWLRSAGKYHDEEPAKVPGVRLTLCV